MSQTDYFNSQIDEHLNSVRETIELSETLNKSNTNKRIIEPFMVFLEWPLTVPRNNSSVELNYETGEDTVTDYALLIENEEKVFINTSPYESEINFDTEDNSQLFDYFDWGIVTNGHNYEFYRQVEEESILVSQFDLDEMVENVDFLTYMSFSSLTSGRTEDEAEAFDSCMTDRNYIEDVDSEVSTMLNESIDTIDDQQVEEEVDLLVASLLDLADPERYFQSNIDVEHTENVENNDVDTDEDDEDEFKYEALDNTEEQEEQENNQKSDEQDTDNSSSSSSSLSGLFSN